MNKLAIFVLYVALYTNIRTSCSEIKKVFFQDAQTSIASTIAMIGFGSTIFCYKKIISINEHIDTLDRNPGFEIKGDRSKKMKSRKMNTGLASLSIPITILAEVFIATRSENKK